MAFITSLHIPTLVVAGFCVVLMCGLLTLVNWRQYPSERILLYTGTMLLLSCPAILCAMLRGTPPYWIAAVLSNVLLLLISGLAWQAVRVFFGHKERWFWTLLGALTWLLLSLVPGFLESPTLRIRIYSALTAAYMLMGCYELVRARKHTSFTIVPMASIFLMHAFIHLARFAYAVPPEGIRELSKVPLIELLILEGVMYVIGVVVVSLMMVKDRTQKRLIEAAYIDVLTGIDNRRSFNTKAASLLRQAQEMGEPVSVLLCDLDHFKKINDLKGHAEGDRALARFASVLAGVFSEHGIYARIGGEEFACLLACDTATALIYAEKIRVLYRAGSEDTPAQTVSVGVAGSSASGYALQSLMAASDSAMYQAKQNGRDQVRLYRASALAVS